MNMCNEIEKILKIQDLEEKVSRIDDIRAKMDDFPTWNRSLAMQDVGEAAANLLKVTFIEENEDVKEAMLGLLVAFVSWHKIDRYIDWDMVIAQIPHLPEHYVPTVLEMIGWSRERKNIPFLAKYLNHPRMWVQMEALNAIAQIWWDMSNQRAEVKKMMQIDDIKYIGFLLLNPGKHHIPDEKIQEKILQVRNVFMASMRNWFGSEDEEGIFDHPSHLSDQG